MAEAQVAPYGSWRSPITADLIVSESVRLGQIELDGDDTYWVEGRPAEGGRNVIVRRTPDSRIADVTPAPFNARTRVHEYGGGAFTVDGGTLYFSHFGDSRLYRQDPGALPRPITPEGPLHYADLIVDRRRGRLICVREDHGSGAREAINTLVALDLEGRDDPLLLACGNDFYAAPRLSPDGSQLAWLTWYHPNMPWDGTELWVAEIEEDGTLGRTELVAGGHAESIFQPAWSPDGILHFVSDRTGWWNLYRWRAGRVEPLIERAAEMGQPQWVFGMSTYAFESAGRIVCAIGEQGTWRLAILDTETRDLRFLPARYTEIADPRAGPGRAVFRGGSPSEPVSVIQLDVATEQFEVLRRSSNVAVDPDYISAPQPIEFPTEDGLTAHGLFYPPRNPDFAALPDERPPLLVMSHGGPTAAASTALNLSIQYWTSRGIAVLDVNYGGSTGYGRAYRERLKDRWGIVDVDDCVNGARYLVEQGLVDGNRLAITGGSAGGYTTLSALTFRDTFKAGASYYGIGDLELLALDTHKFESRYLDGLIGPHPERRDLYLERSPIHHTDRLTCPVILFQGLDDKVVPPNQAETMVEALRARGLPFAYLAFPGEEHGFRRAETIKRALEAELSFYAQVFGFDPADPIEPVPIENLGRSE